MFCFYRKYNYAGSTVFLSMRWEGEVGLGGGGGWSTALSIKGTEISLGLLNKIFTKWRECYKQLLSAST